MDGLKKMEEKILSDAREKAEELIKKAENDADEIRTKAENEAEAYRKERLYYAESEAKKAHERAISAAKMEAKKVMLSAKQKLIDDCFIRAREAILQMPTKEYEELLIDWIVKNADAGGEQLILSAKDAKRITLPRFAAKINARQKKGGRKAAIQLLKETTDAPAGFLLRRGDVVINCTLDAMLASKREELEIELGAILF